MIRSRRYLDGSRGANCTLRLPGCTNDRETVVAAHIRDRNFGMGRKASDLSVVDACHLCHMRLDGQAKLPDGTYFTEESWAWYALRALQETLEARHALGLLIVPEDAPKVAATKPRRPKADRKPIPQPAQTIWPARPMRTRKK